MGYPGYIILSGHCEIIYRAKGPGSGRAQALVPWARAPEPGPRVPQLPTPPLPAPPPPNPILPPPQLRPLGPAQPRPFGPLCKRCV